MPDLDPRRSLLVLLGARVFPKYPTLTGGKMFFNSVSEVLDYATNERGLALDRQNVLDLFDDSATAAEQLEQIAAFLRERQSLASPADRPENVFVYYVGHGLFTPADTKYCLAIRCTNANTIGFSAMRGRDLAEVISTHASHLRRFLILDCCFAGSMVRDFLSAPGEAASQQMIKDLPRRGTCLLCASSFDNPALAPEALGMTMFSSAFLKALREGNPTLEQRMSMIELRDTLTGILQREHSTWVRPELHSPDMRDGEISLLPLFPNPAWIVKSSIEKKGPESERLDEEEPAGWEESEAAVHAEREQIEREREQAALHEQALVKALKSAEAKEQARRKRAEARRARQELLEQEKAEAAFRQQSPPKAMAAAAAPDGTKQQISEARVQERRGEEQKQPNETVNTPRNTPAPIDAGRRGAAVVPVQTRATPAKVFRTFVLSVIGVICFIAMSLYFVSPSQKPVTSNSGQIQPSAKILRFPTTLADNPQSGADMNKRGDDYYFGRGVQQDNNQARQWYEKAALAGNADGMANLGWMDEQGKGGPQDYVQAIQWYEKAAAGGNTEAMNNLGLLYGNGKGTAQDYSKAREWFEKGAAADNADAMDNLGWTYDQGEGVTQDYAKARQWYEKAAAGGNAHAMGQMGELYFYGRGVGQDYVQARQWYEKAANKGYAYAMYSIGWLYEHGYGVTPDNAQARQWYQKAAANGSTDAATRLKTLPN